MLQEHAINETAASNRFVSIIETGQAMSLRSIFSHFKLLRLESQLGHEVYQRIRDPLKEVWRLVH
jgi:hypothetical protein